MINMAGSCPFHEGGEMLTFDVDSEVLFLHSDDTREIDARHDPIREISDALHATGPVVKGRGTGTPLGSKVQFGDVVVPNLFVSSEECAGEVYAAVSWQAVRTAYSSRDFSISGYAGTLGQWGPGLNTMDSPEHSKYRMVAQPGFTSEAIAEHETKLIRPIIARRFAELKPKGRADLARELTIYNAYEVTGAIVGFDVEDIAFVASCFARMYPANVDPNGIIEGGAAIRSYAQKLIEAQRVQPRGDLVSKMIDAKVDGQPIDDVHLNALVVHLLAGGLDTIYKQSGNIIALLLDHPDQFALVKRDRSLIPAVVEEALRYQGVASMLARKAVPDTELLGMPIPAGAIMFLIQAASDRDPTRWADPHMFDIMRPLKQHIQFASGPHHCIAAGVARVVLAVLIEHLLDDLPNLRWDPQQERGQITGWTQRGALRLPVVWDAD